jgi:hypothetical protein
VRRHLLAVAALVVALAGCGYHCRWHSHGACVAVDGEVQGAARAWSDDQWQAVLNETIGNAESYWNSGGVSGWTIVLHEDAPTCFLFFVGEGCAVPVPGDQVIHVHAETNCPTEHIPHEVGHAVLPGHDPLHWHGGWETLDRQPRSVARCVP